MSEWPSTKARRVLAALLKTGWQVKRQTGSHRTLSREGWPDVVFAFHDREEIGPACWRELQNAPAFVLKISKVAKPANYRLKLATSGGLAADLRPRSPAAA